MRPFNRAVRVIAVIVHQWNMDIVRLQLQIVFLVNGWLLGQGAPVAMLQHATSSQSIVFHQPQLALSAPTTTASVSAIDQFSRNQPKYEYKYEVSDHQTGDRKSHWESREGDKVRGVYTLYEPDGALRIVEYSADAIHGFNAVVRREEPTKHQHPRVPEASRNRPLASEYHGGHEYIPERNNNPTSQRYLGQNPDVGFSVNHLAGLQRPDENSNHF